MTPHDVMYHVTMVTCFFIISKEKKNQIKKNREKEKKIKINC